MPPFNITIETERRRVPVNDMPRISQEMVKLYDDYTHLTPDRRDFMQKLSG